ncbi:MAG: type II toxin-antitoxin system VapB family antitoxin [Elusimicrobia bacterium]|nr:type II toxin-antitoxin system VapB family antitoxin [Elusimicrobiota bacterium]
MRTTLDIPEKLLSEARRLSGAKTKTQAIIWGLEELTRRKRIEHLWSLRGKIPLNLDLRRSRAR